MLNRLELVTEGGTYYRFDLTPFRAGCALAYTKG
jgi:hypothetical protein